MSEKEVLLILAFLGWASIFFTLLDVKDYVTKTYKVVAKEIIKKELEEALKSRPGYDE